ncbi:TetR/AcrR family transcriptional regulator [Arthrobacter sp. FW305-BF8]|uniref:TetR/AcrR family transcriptional regulator n=1 Tax=Arthrobacter sp. FW305-BF8 TaxID=2879617 RepID=UPI001F17328B|nr:TetR/AcrR family transcriptional regulator [Arthrobacter sp. FW305-BF8]UKA53944.1 TetR/AcrR family transcriptional regulator [Arthrobacter sp. FW305-BF8]
MANSAREPGTSASWTGADARHGFADPSQHSSAGADTRERILSTAYELFSRRSIRDVGVNELIESSEVAKSTFYRHFPSKDDLVLAVLALRDQIWFSEIVAEAQRRSATPEEELLVIFDVFADRLGDGGYKTNMLIKVLMEMGPDHPLGQASVTYLARIRGHVQAVADDAGLEHSELFARAWHLLLKGSIISAMEGDQQAASLAKDMAGIIIARHRRSLP